MTQLLAMGDQIEMGWYICTWIPHLRHVAKKYDETIVVTQKGLEYFYEFAGKFEYFECDGKNDRWFYHGKLIEVPKNIREKYPAAFVYTPTQKRCMEKKRDYRKYGEMAEGLKYDLVIHARKASKYGTGNKNWPLKNYIELAQKFKGLKTCSIGTRAFYVPGTDDQRNVSAEKLCNILRSSRLVIGTSSGPMHLASHCGTPHVVFSDRTYQKVVCCYNRQRYENLWNPFKTPCKVIDQWGWRPPVKEVIKAVESFMAKI